MKSNHKLKIETPDETQAEYVYEDMIGNPIYFDGSEYWVVESGEVQYYG